MKHFAACATVGLLAVTGAAFAEPAKIAGTVTDVFGHRFVVETATGKVLVDIGPKGADKVVIKRGEKIEIEGGQNEDQLRAHRVTLADGHAYDVDKPGKIWRDWSFGNRAPEPTAPFGSAQAKKLATEKGYQVSGEPVATKKHFTVMASKDGKNYELRVHRDGEVERRVAFGVDEAKKLAADKGYQLTSEPVRMKEHFRAAATKDGKPYEIDLHRDGDIVRHTPFGPQEAKKLVADKGYELVGGAAAGGSALRAARQEGRQVLRAACSPRREPCPRAARERERSEVGAIGSLTRKAKARVPWHATKNCIRRQANSKTRSRPFGLNSARKILQAESVS
jgi:hypothetical protein